MHGNVHSRADRDILLRCCDFQKNRGRKRPSESKDSSEEPAKKSKTSATSKTPEAESAYLQEVRKLQGESDLCLNGKSST